MVGADVSVAPVPGRLGEEGSCPLETPDPVGGRELGA